MADRGSYNPVRIREVDAEEGEIADECTTPHVGRHADALIWPSDVILLLFTLLAVVAATSFTTYRLTLHSCGCGSSVSTETYTYRPPPAPAPAPTLPTPTAPGPPPKPLAPEVNKAASVEGQCWSAALPGSYVKGCFMGCKAHSDLSHAQEECDSHAPGCGGITREKSGIYTLRSGQEALPGAEREISHVREACGGPKGDASLQKKRGDGDLVSEITLPTSSANCDCDDAISVAVAAAAVPAPDSIVGSAMGLPVNDSPDWRLARDDAVISKDNAASYKAFLAHQNGCTTPSKQAYVTLCTSSKYLPGVLTLSRALLSYGAQEKLVVMVTSGSCDTVGAWADLHASGAQVCRVRAIANPDPTEAHYYKDTFSKINLWALPLDVVVYLDSDVLPMDNMDDYFTKLDVDKRIASSSDCGNSQKFYSGLMIVRIAAFDVADMLSKLDKLESSDGGDLGFINSYILGGVDCRKKEAAEKGFQSIAETDHWVRSKYCGKYKEGSRLYEWLGGNVDEKDEQQLVRDEEAINTHLSEIRAIHYPGHTKPWWHCKNSDQCDTKMGRGASLDQLYIRTMQTLGLWDGDVARVGSIDMFNAADLSPAHVKDRCPDYEEDPTKYPQYNLHVECGGSGGLNEPSTNKVALPFAAERDARATLGWSLANYRFSDCKERCVYGADVGPVKAPAWKWNPSDVCWRRDEENKECRGLTGRGSFSRSSIYNLPIKHLV